MDFDTIDRMFRYLFWVALISGIAFSGFIIWLLYKLVMWVITK
jgi:hypothetical protein